MGNVCSVEGCNNNVFCKGYCTKHYKQNYRHGHILDRTIYDKNEFVFHDGCVEMFLYNKNGEVIGSTVFDIEDYNSVKEYKWTLTSHGYVVCRVNNFSLHRFILNTIDDSVYVDHINGDVLDNRKCNLREVTPQQNNFNMTNKGQGDNQRKGVSYRKDRGKWRAYITVNSKQITLGCFNTEEEAIQAREEAEIKYFGDFRRKDG